MKTPKMTPAHALILGARVYYEENIPAADDCHPNMHLANVIFYEESKKDEPSIVELVASD